MKITAWLKQPTTINGLGALAATLVMGAVYLVTRNSVYTGMAGTLTFGILHVAVNDNSTEPSDVEKLAIDAAQALITKKITAAIPTLLADVTAVAKDMTAPAAPVTPPTTPAA